MMGLFAIKLEEEYHSHKILADPGENIAIFGVQFNSAGRNKLFVGATVKNKEELLQLRLCEVIAIKDDYASGFNTIHGAFHYNPFECSDHDATLHLGIGTMMQAAEKQILRITLPITSAAVSMIVAGNTTLKMRSKQMSS